MVGFRKVKAWQKAHALTLGLYRATRSFPKEELFGLMLWGFIRKLPSDV